jgi:hypothetical protein
MASRSSKTLNFIMYVFIFNLILGGQFGFRSVLKDYLCKHECDMFNLMLKKRFNDQITFNMEGGKGNHIPLMG